MLDARLYMAQRLSALAMVPLVVGHLAVMIHAVQDGLTVEEILGRTQGSVAWFLFYGAFVVAASVHGAIGLRVVTHETTGLRGPALSGFMWLVGLALTFLGARAVTAVTML